MNSLVPQSFFKPLTGPDESSVRPLLVDSDRLRWGGEAFAAEGPRTKVRAIVALSAFATITAPQLQAYTVSAEPGKATLLLGSNDDPSANAIKKINDPFENVAYREVGARIGKLSLDLQLAIAALNDRIDQLSMRSAASPDLDVASLAAPTMSSDDVLQMITLFDPTMAGEREAAAFDAIADYGYISPTFIGASVAGLSAVSGLVRAAASRAVAALRPPAASSLLNEMIALEPNGTVRSVAIAALADVVRQ